MGPGCSVEGCMTTQEVKDYIKQNIDRLAAKAGVPHWRIVLSFCRLPEYDNSATAMRVFRKDEYEKACIEIDADHVLDETEEESGIDSCVMHELLHLHTSPYLHAEELVHSLCGDQHYDAIRSAFNIADERTVRNMERLVYALTHKEPNGSD